MYIEYACSNAQVKDRERERKKLLGTFAHILMFAFLPLCVAPFILTSIYIVEQTQYSHLFPFRIKFVTILISLIYSNSLWFPLFFFTLYRNSLVYRFAHGSIIMMMCTLIIISSDL